MSQPFESGARDRSGAKEQQRPANNKKPPAVRSFARSLGLVFVRLGALSKWLAASRARLCDSFSPLSSLTCHSPAPCSQADRHLFDWRPCACAKLAGHCRRTSLPVRQARRQGGGEAFAAFRVELAWPLAASTPRRLHLLSKRAEPNGATSRDNLRVHLIYRGRRGVAPAWRRQRNPAVPPPASWSGVLATAGRTSKWLCVCV